MPNKKHKIKQQIPPLAINERVRRYIADNSKLLERHGIRSMPVIHFAKRKRVPIWSKIALRILKRQGGILDTRFEILNKT